MNTSTSPRASPPDFQSTPKNKDRASALAQSFLTQPTIHEQLALAGTPSTRDSVHTPEDINQLWEIINTHQQRISGIRRN